MFITIDDREQNADLYHWLEQLAPGHWKKERLPVGDFRIDSEDTVLVERKTLDDFALSLIQGRLFSQAAKMKSSASRRLLILEGEQTSSKIDSRSVRGAEIALIAKFGIPVMRTLSAKETIEVCCYLARQVCRTQELVQFSGYRRKSRKGRQLQLIQQLPGIGAQKAKLLLEHYGSVRAIFNASPSELASLKQIGKNTVDAIEDFISEAACAFVNRRSAA